MLNIHQKHWCWSWNSNTLATWGKELTHWKRPWCWERLKVGEEGDDRGWDGWMASLTQWTWVGDGQGSLACCSSPWGHKESDMTEWVNWTEIKVSAVCCNDRRGSQWARNPTNTPPVSFLKKMNRKNNEHILMRVLQKKNPTHVYRKISSNKTAWSTRNLGDNTLGGINILTQTRIWGYEKPLWVKNRKIMTDTDNQKQSVKRKLTKLRKEREEKRQYYLIPQEYNTK